MPARLCPGRANSGQGLVLMFLLRHLLRSDPRRRFVQHLDIDLKSRLERTLLVLLGLIVLHTLAMMAFESLGVAEAVWLTMTTLTTVGYGDLSATTPAGQAATVALLYIVGITLLAQLASDYIDYRIQRKSKMIRGQWRWKMKHHIVIVNAPKANAETYFLRLVTQIRNSRDYHECAVQILTRDFPEGLPQSLQALGVVHYHGYPDDDDSLRTIEVDKARAVFILARDEYARSSDSLTLDVVHRVREQLAEPGPRVIAESVLDNNRQRLVTQGADTTLRPVRSYPEMLVQALVAPGAERVLENLFTHQNDHTASFAVALHNRSWREVVTALMDAGLGTALAYVTPDNEVVSHPPADHCVDARALIMIVGADAVPSEKLVRRVLAAE
jgi:voltage-gated potassium channel